MLVLGGAVCGFFLFAASASQQIGISLTTTAKAGFITALYVVLVPVLSVFMHRSVNRKVWGCVMLAVIGLYLLCMGESFSLSAGDSWMLLCAFLFSLQILSVNYFVKYTDPVKLAALEFLFEGIFAGICMLLLEPFDAEGILSALPSILYAGFMSSAVGYTLQIVAQDGLDPAVASIAMLPRTPGTAAITSDAIHEGVRRGYEAGYLRKSIVADPIRRGNTGDNTPAAITVHLVPGDGLKITVAPKGFGSENMSRLAMLKPADGVEGVKNFVYETVKIAGPNPCPPIVLGIGIGGSFDKVAALAKQALLRPLDEPNPDPYYAALEQELLEGINALGIGPQGFGGKTTALGVSIETMATHVAGLPVAVNVSCHVTRRASAEL